MIGNESIELIESPWNETISSGAKNDKSIKQHFDLMCVFFVRRINGEQEYEH